MFDIKEATAYLKLSKSTIYRMTMDREIPHYKVGKRLYFRKNELEAWINKGKVATQEEISEQADQFLLRRGRR